MQTSPSTAPTASKAERLAPPELLCPLSGKLLKDPVLADDGYNYDRQAWRTMVAKWDATGQATHPSPVAPQDLRRKGEVSNGPLARYVCDWVNGEPEDELHARLSCPISTQLLTEPVLLASEQQTYDWSQIRAWLSKSNLEPVNHRPLGPDGTVVALHPDRVMLTLSANAQGCDLSDAYIAKIAPLRLGGGTQVPTPPANPGDTVLEIEPAPQAGTRETNTTLIVLVLVAGGASIAVTGLCLAFSQAKTVGMSLFLAGFCLGVGALLTPICVGSYAR